MNTTVNTISKDRFAAIIAAARKRTELLASQGLYETKSGEIDYIGEPDNSDDPGNEVASVSEQETKALPTELIFKPISEAIQEQYSVTTDKYGNQITYNKKQNEFITTARTWDINKKCFKSCILIGAAGTGKTTCMKGTVAGLSQSAYTGILQSHNHAHLPRDVPGIVVCAYTRRATNNIRRNMDKSMQGNCITIHKLLEYAPVYYEVEGSDGNLKNTMRFEPTRNRYNPLPREITTIIIEESSMVGTDLFAQLVAAIDHPVQWIFLGDIQQLPPVFGPAILGFKLLELPAVELTEVYRQALESPIIRLAHRILSGQEIIKDELPSWSFPGELKIVPYKNPRGPTTVESALEISKQLFIKFLSEGYYNPEDDVILIPFNKSYGTIELNKSIANHIARSKALPTWEVVAGFLKHYFTVGDKVLYDREDGLILDIYPNPAYTGAHAQHESTYLDYWGHNNAPKSEQDKMDEMGEDEVDIDFVLSQVSADSEDRVTQASHCIKILLQDSGLEKIISKAAEVNALILGYALTIHKSQGSEWEKVFLLIHQSHSTMLSRELLYTACTRAKKELFVLCEPDTFVKGIKTQRVKGNTLAEKAIFFQGKVKDLQSSNEGEL